MVNLSPAELSARAARIALVLSDNDGVLTDGAVWVSARGEELLRYSRRDGMAVERLREHGIATAIVTREPTEIVKRRAEKLAVAHLFAGVRDKREYLPRICAEMRATLAQIAYIGDDVNDLGIIDAIAPHGLTAAPADAMPPVRRRVHLVCDTEGGKGAFRELAERLLSLRCDESTGGDR